MKKQFRSMILEYFPVDLCIELKKISLLPDADNNMKGSLIKKKLLNFHVPYTSLGSGTNRMAVLIDGYAVKIALDDDGCIDNKREFLYTRELQPYVVKVEECSPDGLIAVTEYVDIFTIEDYRNHINDMREILKDISENFLLGDVGITTKNYVNWGTRANGTICILDFAYIYSTSFNVFRCTCNPQSILHYDSNYNNLICPICGRKYTFGEIRRRISRKQQADEIGDIKQIGYVLHKPVETLEVDESKSYNPKDKQKKEKKVKKKFYKLEDYLNGNFDDDSLIEESGGENYEQEK